MYTVQSSRYATFCIRYMFKWNTSKSVEIDLNEVGIKKSIKESLMDLSGKPGIIIEDVVVRRNEVAVKLKSEPNFQPSLIASKLKGCTGRRIEMKHNIGAVWSRGYTCYTLSGEE